MSESLPQYATIAPSNLIIDDGGSILSVTSQASLFRKERMLDPRRSVRWRSTSAGQQQILGQFRVAILPTVFALIDSNVASGETVTLELADDQGMTTNKQTWNFTTYEAELTRVNRWYPGTPDAGGSAAARSFYRITLPANGTQDSDGDGAQDTYHQLGVPFLGVYARLPVNLGFEREVIDPSVIAESDGGAIYPDVRSSYIECSIEAPLLDDASSVAFMKMLRQVGVHRHVLFDAWGWSTDAEKKSDGCIYGRMGGRDTAGSLTRRYQMFDSADLTIVEARA